MAQNTVVDLQPAISVKQKLQQFDVMISQLTCKSVADNKNVKSFEQLAGCLDSAIQNGLDLMEAQSRTEALTLLAFEKGYTQEEVEALLTVCSQRNENFPIR